MAAKKVVATEKNTTAGQFSHYTIHAPSYSVKRKLTPNPTVGLAKGTPKCVVKGSHLIVYEK